MTDIQKLLNEVEYYKMELKKCETIKNNLALEIIDLKEQLEKCKKYFNSNEK